MINDKAKCKSCGYIYRYDVGACPRCSGNRWDDQRDKELQDIKDFAKSIVFGRVIA